MSMTSLSTKSRRPEDVVMEGWLHKRGEHVRNWRPRYFVLFHDGVLLGFRKEPKEGQPYTDPLNDFMIKDATMTMEKPCANMFTVRCLQWTTVIERTFYADSADIRQRWISAIESITKRYSGNTASSIQEEPMDSASIHIEKESEKAGAAHAIVGQPSAPMGGSS